MRIRRVSYPLALSPALTPGCLLGAPLPKKGEGESCDDTPSVSPSPFLGRGAPKRQPGVRAGDRAGAVKRFKIFAAALFLTSALTLFAQPVQAQSGGAPPPPPTEGLNPATAPASSRETGEASPPAPAPPAEGIDPANAPATSRGAAPAATPHAPTATPKPSAAANGDSVEVEAATPDTSSKASPATVFQLDFMQRALLAGLLVGGACAFLGVYVVLRRIVFVGVALAEMSSAGVALALLIGLSPMLGSVLVMLAGVVLVSVRWGGRRIRQDAFIGIGYIVASAASILMLAKSPSGEASLLDLLFGNILTATATDIQATAIALGLMLLFHLVFYKEILFVAFDPDTASASGYNARLWELALYLTIGLTIAFSIHAVGVLLTFASLVVPAVTALLLTRRMGTAFGVAIAAGTIPVPLGLYLSFVADLPAAATIVVLGFALLLIAGGVSRLRA